MGKFKETAGDAILDAIVPPILNILFLLWMPIGWILSLLGKFLSDVMKHLYGRVVAIVAGAILLYTLSHLFR